MFYGKILLHAACGKSEGKAVVSWVKPDWPAPIFVSVSRCNGSYAAKSSFYLAKQVIKSQHPTVLKICHQSSHRTFRKQQQRAWGLKPVMSVDGAGACPGEYIEAAIELADAAAKITSQYFRSLSHTWCPKFLILAIIKEKPSSFESAQDYKHLRLVVSSQCSCMIQGMISGSRDIAIEFNMPLKRHAIIHLQTASGRRAEGG